MREEWPLAGFWDRWFGDLCDGLIGISVAGFGYLLIDRALLHSKAGFLDESSFSAAEAFIIVWFIWNLTYLVGSRGQSWGRRLAGIKVVNDRGEPIGFWRALGRNLVAMYVSAPLLYLGFIWVVWDSQKQAWHDKIFRTFVVRRVVR